MSTSTVSSENGAPRDDQGVPIPPHDLIAEQAALGTMLLSADAIAEVMEIIAGRDFYKLKHAELFDAIITLYGRGEPVDHVTITAELVRRDVFNRIGGAPYLHTLMATATTAANGAHYAEIVAEKAQLRRLIAAGTRVVQLGYNGAAGADLAEVVNRAQAAIHDATTSATRVSDGLVPAEDVVALARAQLTSTAPRDVIMTGLTDLDDITGGLPRSQVIVVCGRPGHGKTALGMQFVANAVLEQDKSGLVFSMEMDRTELMLRLLASTPKRGIHQDKLTRVKPMEPADWQTLELAEARLNAARLWIDDSTYQTVATIRTALRRHIQHEGPPDIVMIDYLGLLTPMQKHGERRDLEIGEITRELKILAGELKITILLLHQLNRSGANRADPRPRLTDLRDGGSTEQDAYMVISVYNPGVDDPDDRSGEAQLANLKNRGRAGGIAKVAAQLHYARYADLARTP